MRPIPPALLLAFLSSVPLAAQIPETMLFDIQQTGIGSNGFSTSWRGQDLELPEDTWMTRFAFQAGSAAQNIDEMRVMTAMPSPANLAITTSIIINGNWVEATWNEPFYLLGGTTYTIWFHQQGSPRGTYGCNLTLVNPSWGAHHTNLDPTQIATSGEPSYYRYYQYGTNVKLYGYDNLTINPASVGAPVTIDLQTNANDLFVLMFAAQSFNLPLPPIAGPLRVDPGTLALTMSGLTSLAGTWSLTFPLPNDPSLRGAIIHGQAYHTPAPTTFGAFSTMEVVTIL